METKQEEGQLDSELAKLINETVITGDEPVKSSFKEQQLETKVIDKLFLRV